MNQYTVRVLLIWNPSAFTRAIRVEKPPELVFQASQAMRLIFGPELMRPMTIASGPARPHLDFAVEQSDSEFKRALFALKVGDTLELLGPRGAFFLERDRPAVMIASGMGITPFRSMLEALADEAATLAGVLVHATRGNIDVPFRAEIDALAERAGLRLVRRWVPSGPSCSPRSRRT